MNIEFELHSLVSLLFFSLLFGLIVFPLLLFLCVWQSCPRKKNNEKIDGRKEEEDIGDDTFNKAQSTDVSNNFKKTRVILDNKGGVKSKLEPLSGHGISNKNKHEVKWLTTVANADKVKKTHLPNDNSMKIHQIRRLKGNKCHKKNSKTNVAKMKDDESMPDIKVVESHKTEIKDANMIHDNMVKPTKISFKCEENKPNYLKTEDHIIKVFLFKKIEKNEKIDDVETVKSTKMEHSKMIDIDVVQPSKITQKNQELKDIDEDTVSVPKTQMFEIEELQTEKQDTRDFGSKHFDEDMKDELSKQGNSGDQKLKLSRNGKKKMKKKQKKIENKKEIDSSKANNKNKCNVDVEPTSEDGHDVNYKSDENDEDNLPPRKKIKRFKSLPPHLKNLGNTCFLNSSLQVIYQTQILGHLLNEFNKEHSSEPTERRLQESMRRFYSNPNNPHEILNHVRNRSNRFHNYKQEDSHDLITHLFRGIKEEQEMILDKSQYSMDKESLISINKVFLGHMLRFSICTKCHQTHHVVQKIYDLSLPISFNLDDEKSEDVDFPKESCNDNCFKVIYDLMVKEISLHGSNFTLERCLKQFTKREFGPNLCQHCYEMNPSTDNLPPAFSRTLYIDLPPVVMIYFMRFQQTQYGTFKKCKKSVQYPKILDLSPYMVREASHYRYSLYGVVEHSGSMESGHYVAYVKVREDSKNMLLEFINAKKFHKDHVTKEWLIEQLTAFGGKKHEDLIIDDTEKEWYYTSDTYVNKINEWEAMNREAILLFYEKIK